MSATRRTKMILAGVLAVLAFLPWVTTLGFGVAGVVELSTPWAIPIGYAYALLWLRNLDALCPQATLGVLAALRRAWLPVVVAVLLLGAAIGAAAALIKVRKTAP